MFRPIPLLGLLTSELTVSSLVLPLTLQHAARGAPWQNIHLLCRLLVPWLHPLRVSLREPAHHDLLDWSHCTQGFPPFSGSTPEETWANLKNWPKVLRRPVYDRQEDLIFNLTDVAWDAVTR